MATVKGPGVLASDDALALSPPRSLRVTSSEMVSKTYVQASREATASNASTVFRIAFDIRIIAAGTGEAVTTRGGFRYGNGDDYDISLVVSSALAGVQIAKRKSPEFSRIDFDAPLPLDKWVHVELTAEHMQDGWRLSATTDGIDRIAPRTAMPPWASAPATAAPYIGYGVTYIGGPSTPWELRFDNVAMYLAK
jgi:hypothetical protein